MAVVRKSDTLIIQRWYSGLFTNRNTLVTPVSVQGMHVIERYDTLIDGLNMELSPRNTVVRRPGWSVQCSASVTDPRGFYSHRKLDSTVLPLVDTLTKVQTFTPSSVTDLFTKGGGAGRTRFQSVGDFVYMVNGTDEKSWDGATVRNMGVIAPTQAPTISINTNQGPPVSSATQIVSSMPAQQAAASASTPTWEWDGIQWRIKTSGGAANTHELIVSFTVPNLPVNSVITGMQLAFDAASQNANPNQNNLNSAGWWNGSAIDGTPKSDSTVWPTAKYQTFTYGGTTDLWGKSGATVAATSGGTISFGISATNGNYRGFLRNFKLTIYVSNPGPWPSLTNVALGTTLVDTNNNTQVVTTAGTTGSSQPTWNAVVGGTTSEAGAGGTAVWTNYGSVAAAAASAAPSISPTSGYKYGYCFKKSATNEISTMSLASASTGPQSNVTVTVTAQGSSETGVDKVQIYRPADGGATYYLLAELTNPGGSSNWTYTDAITDGLLNTFIVAPLAHANDPPPAGASNIIHHVGRLWIAVGNKVYFAGGPDVTNGNGDTCFPPANVFVFPGQVTAFASVSAGLLVFTPTDTYIIRGLTSKSFYSRKYLSNFGALSADAVTQDGDMVYVFTQYSQLYCLTPDNLEEVGFDISDILQTWNPANVYIKLHRAGVDGGLFICDGSTSMFRYTISKSAWSTKAQPVNGCVCIGSIQTSSGVQRLLMGQSGTRNILYRNLSNWQDNGNNYGAFATVGSIVLASLGNTAPLTAILLERAATGTAADIDLLLNELSGDFTSIGSPVNEPPRLKPSATVSANRYWLSNAGVPLPQQIHHLQVKVSFAAENAQSEILTLGLMPPQE